MKKLFIKLFISSTYDFLIIALERMASKTDNDIDDQMVGMIKTNRKAIIREIIKAL